MPESDSSLRLLFDNLPRVLSDPHEKRDFLQEQHLQSVLNRKQAWLLHHVQYLLLDLSLQTALVLQ